MTKIARISVYVPDRLTAPATVETAGHIAAQFDAALLGVHVQSGSEAVTIASGGVVDPLVLDEFDQRARAQAEEAQKIFRLVTENHGWQGTWLGVDDRGAPFRENVARALRHADLVVVGQDDPAEDGPSNAALVDDIVVDAGRPVLLSPVGWKSGAGQDHVVIAWKDGREAARAVHDALPFLERAGKVTVTTAISENRPGQDDDSCEELRRYLSAHGIEAESHPLHGVSDGSVGEALMGHIDNVGADMLVLGAYSHSRLREGLFGGVTREVLDGIRIPALLSH